MLPERFMSTWTVSYTHLDVYKRQGYHVYRAGFNQKIAVINVAGRVFMPALDCPFRTAEQIIADFQDVDYIIIDIHAEATSEKQAFGYYFDGKVSAVLGTHTHIQTADERILPEGLSLIHIWFIICILNCLSY